MKSEPGEALLMYWPCGWCGPGFQENPFPLGGAQFLRESNVLYPSALDLAQIISEVTKAL